MYKLIATTALVAVTATSASAWTDAKSIIETLHETYTAVDGGGQYTALENGALNTFITSANSGVSHLTLAVDENNSITAELTPGKLLSEIQTDATDLVNRVNYDLFVDTVGDGAGYVNGTDYKDQGNIVFTAVDNSVPAEVTQNYEGKGLVGIKIDKLITGVEAVNDLLIGTDASGDAARAAFAGEWNAANAETDPTAATVNLGINDIVGHIDGLNTATSAIGGTDVGKVNEGLNGISLTETNLNNFTVPGLGTDGKVTIAGGTNYNSLLEWANAQ